MCSAVLHRLLDWDSSFYGIRIGRVERTRVTDDQLIKILEWCRYREVRCLYFLCAPDDDESVRLAEANGFHLVDVRIELDRPIGRTANGFGTAPRGIGIRPHKAEDVESLESIATEAYRDTRFCYDRHFDRQRVAAFYREWIARSCSGYADRVLVAHCDEQIVGYVTCHADPGAGGRIGLVGVAPGMQGAKVGQLLVESALSYFESRHVLSVSVVTQGRNVAAQRLYQKCGFRTTSVNLWYHKWFSR